MAAVDSFGYSIIDFSSKWLKSIGIKDDVLIPTRTLILFIIAVLTSIVLWWIVRKTLISLLHKVVLHSKTKWDDYLVEKKFFAAIAYIAPLLLFDLFSEIIFHDYPEMANLLTTVFDLLFVVVVLLSVIRFLSTFEKILSEKPNLKDKPIQSYFQLLKILVSGFMATLFLSISTGQSPIYFLTSLGAATAIILLIFKDIILGFVGSIQLAANDMVRIGDWVTMEKFGADGTVIEINLASVKVQNFDNTITTIPTYSFISDSFKNWRGMRDSGGRRIKRSISIEMNSVKFFTKEDLERLQNIEFIRDYINTKEKDIKEHNNTKKVENTFSINGRNQTNIGLFREYVKQYLLQNPNINQDMMIMVRQLPPTPTGLPVEVYCFTKDKDWILYENVMSDIFDHILAATSTFGLSVFESPTGNDVRSITNQ